MATQPLDDALAQIDALCAALRITGEELVDAAGQLAPAEADDAADALDTPHEDTVVASVDGAEAAAEDLADGVEAVVAALRECAAGAREGADGPVARAQADLQAAATHAETGCAEWRARVAAAGDELGTSGFEATAEALDAVEAAAQRATDELRAAGDALHQATASSVRRLAEVEAEISPGLDEAIAVAGSVIEALHVAEWAQRWEAAPVPLEDAAGEAGQGLDAQYTDWVAAVEAALGGQEETARAAAAAAADALATGWGTLESAVAACLEQRQGLRSELGDLAAALEHEAAEAPEVTSTGGDLAVALNIAGIVEEAMRALKE